MGFIVNFNISDYDKITRESPTEQPDMMRLVSSLPSLRI